MEKDELAKLIISEIKDVKKDIVDLKVISAKQEENLKEHMKRSDMLEGLYTDIREEMKPIKTHVDHINGGLKLIGLMATCAGIVAAVFEVIKFFS